MPHFLDRLRAKPPHYRRIVALTFVTVVVSLIFVLWFVTLLPKISSSQNSQYQIGEDYSSGGTPRPFSALTDQVRRLYGSGVQMLTDFTEFGEPIEYVQEKKLPDNVSGFSNSKDTSEKGE